MTKSEKEELVFDIIIRTIIIIAAAGVFFAGYIIGSIFPPV